jgi:hypothetical protein
LGILGVDGSLWIEIFGHVETGILLMTNTELLQRFTGLLLLSYWH